MENVLQSVFLHNKRPLHPHPAPFQKVNKQTHVCCMDGSAALPQIFNILVEMSTVSIWKFCQMKGHILECWSCVVREGRWHVLPWTWTAPHSPALTRPGSEISAALAAKTACTSAAWWGMVSDSLPLMKEIHALSADVRYKQIVTGYGNNFYFPFGFVSTITSFNWFPEMFLYKNSPIGSHTLTHARPHMHTHTGIRTQACWLYKA